MIALYNGESHNFVLKCYRANSNVLEDFTDAEVFLFLVGADKTPLAYTIENNVIKFSLGANLNPEAYDIEVIWSKQTPIVRRHLNSKVYNFVKVQDAFALTEHRSEATGMTSDQVVQIISHAASYGYDGLNSYELAVVRGVTTLSEKNWVANLSEMNNRINGAVTEANTARDAANTAAGRVETAISNANTATAAANTATSNANTATSNANTATAAANTAKANADAATAKALATEKSVSDAEALRVSQENTRLANEGSLASQSGRVWAEKLRSDAETLRASAELARESQAGSDHSRAESDHSTASSDHTEYKTIIEDIALTYTEAEKECEALESGIVTKVGEHETEIGDLKQMDDYMWYNFPFVNHVGYGGVKTTTKLTISDPDGNKTATITSASSAYYNVMYFLRKFPKGTRIKFVGKSSDSRAQKIGWCSGNPAELTTLVGLTLDNVAAKAKTGDWDWEIIAPYDGYLVFYYYKTSNWISREWRIWDKSFNLENVLGLRKIALSGRYLNKTDECSVLSNAHYNCGAIGGTIGTASSSNYKGYKHSVNEGDKIRVTIHKLASKKTNYIYFTDENNVVIWMGDKCINECDKRIDLTVPSGAAWLYADNGNGGVDFKLEILSNDAEYKHADGIELSADEISVLGNRIALLDKLVDGGLKYEQIEHTGTVKSATIENNIIISQSSGNYKVRYMAVDANDLIRIKAGNTSREYARWIYVGWIASVPKVGDTISNAKDFTPKGTNDTPFETDDFYLVPAQGYLVFYTYGADVTTNLDYLEFWKVKSNGGSNTEIMSRIIQSKYVSGDSSSIPSLGLLHYTDIHGDDYAAKEINNVINKYAQFTNGVLCTGDVVYYYWNSSGMDYKWWQSCGLAEKSLFTLGNHDGYNGTSWDGKGRAWDYQQYIEPYIESVGYDMPTGYNVEGSANYQPLYWKKDYASQKTRLIGLDCMHHHDGILNPATGAIETAGTKSNDNAQELWLIDTLNEAKTLGYSVVVVCHYPLDDFKNANMEYDDDTHRWVYNKTSTGGNVMKTVDERANFGLMTSYDAKSYLCLRNNNGTGDVNNIGNILEYWRANGGKFVAWICGHTHYDGFYYPTKFPNLLVVVNNMAGNTRGTNLADRDTLKSETRTCCNFYSIDTANGYFKIVRLGLNTNKYLHNVNTLCYDYVNRKVVSMS